MEKWYQRFERATWIAFVSLPIWIILLAVTQAVGWSFHWKFPLGLAAITLFVLHLFVLAILFLSTLLLWIGRRQRHD